MNFIHKISDSIYSPEFYNDLRGSTLGAAIKYFVLLCLLLTVIYVITLIIPFNTFANSFLKSAPDYYPADLTVTIHNGILHTNVKEPYYIPAQNSYSVNKNFVVIDTTKGFSQKQFDKFSTDVWVTKDTVFLNSDNGQMRAYSLSKIKDLTINKQKIIGLDNTIQKYMPVIILAVFILLLIVFYIVYLFNLVIIFLLAFIIWLIAKKLVQKLTYKQSYIIGLYTVTAGLIFTTILRIFNETVNFPIAMIVIAIVVFIINYRSAFVFGRK